MTTELPPELVAIASDLASRVEDEALGRVDADRPFKQEIFVELMAAELAVSRDFADPQFAYHSHTRSNAKVQVYGATLSGDGSGLFLIACDYAGAPEPSIFPRTKAVSLAEQAARYLRFALSGRLDVGMTEDAKSLTQFVADAWPDVEEVSVVVLTDSVFDGKPILLPSIEGRPLTCDVFDLRRLHRLTAGETGDIEVSAADLPEGGLPRISRSIHDDDYDCSLTIIPGQLLADLYETHGVKLLEFNVRAFLGSNNKVNAGIRRTLKSEPKRFLAYNNGISATAREVTLSADGSSVIGLSGLQIVNGGQTVAALHHVSHVERFDISEVEVPTKLTLVKSADEASFVGEVSSYANTQSVVQMADFSANRPFNIVLERLSRRIWIPGERGQWFFERTRGQYNVAKTFEGSGIAARRRFREKCPPSRKFSKTDLAKFENCWAQLPHEVSNGAQYNYRSWLNAVEEAEWSPDETWFKHLIAKAIIFKAAQREVREQKFPGYRAQIVAYLVSLLSLEMGDTISLDAIWARQAPPNDLLLALPGKAIAVDQAIRTSADRQNISQWCKRPACWEQVKVLTGNGSVQVPVLGMTEA